jgi:GMP synthase (glutamine-hydrolysing)
MTDAQAIQMAKAERASDRGFDRACTVAPVPGGGGRVADPKPVLLILHQPHSVPGHIGRTLALQGHPLDIRRPRFGDPLPETLADHDGLVIFGGPMSANDPDDYIKVETDYIGVALRENAPFLGVCLGAQMMANHLGSRVYQDNDGRVEIGYHRIRPTGDVYGEGAWPETVYQWHKEGFDLADGCVPLAAGGEAFPNQAYRYGETAVGIQFHPEITYAMVSRWSGHNPGKLQQVGAQARAGQLRDHITHAPNVLGWLDRFLGHWVENGRVARGIDRRAEAAE